MLCLIMLCFHEEGKTSPLSLCGPAPHTPFRLDHLSRPIVLQDAGLFIGFWSHRLPVLRSRIRSQQSHRLSVGNMSSNFGFPMRGVIWPPPASALCSSGFYVTARGPGCSQAFHSCLLINRPRCASPPNPSPFSSFSQTVTFLDPGTTSDSERPVNERGGRWHREDVLRVVAVAWLNCCRWQHPAHAHSFSQAGEIDFNWWILHCFKSFFHFITTK